MATVSKPRRTRTLPPLENGDFLDQPTFHQRYEAMPEEVRAELIGGMVFMTSPQRAEHGYAERLLNRWLDEYIEATPGTNAIQHTTQILGPDSEPEESDPLSRDQLWLSNMAFHGDFTPGLAKHSKNSQHAALGFTRRTRPKGSRGSGPYHV